MRRVIYITTRKHAPLCRWRSPWTRVEAGASQASAYFFCPAFCFAQRAFCASLIALRAFADIFRMLGTAAADKKHVLYDAGHDLPLKEKIREELDWLDKYLGPVHR